MRKANLGLIGLGSIGKIHFKNCLHLENARLVSVADSSKKALKFVREFGIKNIQTDYKKLLDDKNIDAVIISVPNFLHCECACKAAEAGKDIFLEKPLARNPVEGEKILSCIKQEGVKLMIGYPSRFSEVFTKLKYEIESGTLGDIQMAYATNISEGPFSPRGEPGIPSQVPAWWFNREMTGGGAFLDLGIHLVSLFRWYFGDVLEAKSLLGYRFNMDSEDHAACLLRFKNGPFATITVGWFSKDPRVSVELYGTVKHASVVRSSPTVLEIIADGLRRKLGKVERSLARYFRELEYFVECVNNDVPPSPSGEEALQDLKVISMAYKNALRFDS